MKIILLLLLIFCAFFLFCSCHVSTCSKYRTGTFHYRFKMENDSFYFLIIRTDSIQMEINERSHDTSKMAIRWTGDCTYELRFLESTGQLTHSQRQFKKSLIIETTILNDKENYYLFEAKSNVSDKIVKDTIWLQPKEKSVSH